MTVLSKSERRMLFQLRRFANGGLSPFASPPYEERLRRLIRDGYLEVQITEKALRELGEKHERIEVTTREGK